jgi:DNA-binding transcriptional ArsR family regulator
MDADKQVCGREPDSQYVELAVEVFSMLADATRVRLILALRDGEFSVNHLAEIVDKSPAAVSQHLAKLRMARIVMQSSRPNTRSAARPVIITCRRKPRHEHCA